MARKKNFNNFNSAKLLGVKARLEADAEKRDKILAELLGLLDEMSGIKKGGGNEQ